MSREDIARELLAAARELIAYKPQGRDVIENIIDKVFERGRILHNDREQAIDAIMTMYRVGRRDAEELLEEAESQV